MNVVIWWKIISRVYYVHNIFLDELLSHERLTANEEMRKKVQKQQSLPDNNNVPRRKSLKESLMEVVKKPKQFESLKQSLVTLRSNTATVVIPEEKEENLTPKEKEPPIKELPSESKISKKCNFFTVYACSKAMFFLI